eukprot:gene25362-31812_t
MSESAPLKGTTPTIDVDVEAGMHHYVIHPAEARRVTSYSDGEDILWAVNSLIPANSEVRNAFNITSETNLFETAGCMLRLALAPTDTIIVQLGFHYRCGDHNYKGAHLHPEMANHMQCSVKTGVPWNGTHAVDELSMASPVDSGRCGRDRINALTTLATSSSTPQKPPPHVIAYIASDSPESAAQISATLAHPHTVIAPPGCHIDFDPSAQCSRDTLLHWFALTLSDFSVFQSFVDGDSGMELAASSFSRLYAVFNMSA